MKRMGRPPPNAEHVQRWTGRRWVPDDGKSAQAFIGQARGANMAWAVDAADAGETPLTDRAMDHCYETFKNVVNGALLHLGKHAAVAVLINEEGQVLSIARKNNALHFGLPGGKCEYGEDPARTAIRELEEETGLLARKDQTRHLYQGVDAEGWTVDAYLVYDWAGEPRPAEGQEVRWTPWKGLYGPPWGAYNRAVQRALKEDRRRVLQVAESYINDAKGCKLADVALHVGQEVHPHGRIWTLVDELVAKKRVCQIRYRAGKAGKYNIPHQLLLPKGSVML